MSSIKDWQNRNLDIEEILARDYSPNVLIDAYEYFMRKCNWNPELINCIYVKDFLLCEIFIAEVEYGGFEQFLSDSSGNMTFETIEALKKVDKEYAEMLISATRFFPGGTVPKDQQLRNEIIGTFNDDTIKQLYELRSCELIKRDEDVLKKLFDYIHEHETEFLNY